MIGDFLDWWTRAMATLIPPAIARAITAPGPRLLVALDEPPATVTLHALADGRQTLLGRFGLDAVGLAALRALALRQGADLPLLLARPRAMFIDKLIDLPAAARRYLAAVIASELDQETPYTPEEVYAHATPVADDPVRGRITARLALIRRDRVDPVLDRLRAAGLDPTLIAADPPEPMLEIPLDPDRPALAAATRRLLVAAAVLAVAVLAVPFVRQSLALGAVEARIAAARPDYEAAQSLRRRLEGAGAAERDAADPLQMLATLTDLVPDDTCLVALTLHARDLALTGRSASATALLAKLAADGRLADPSFTGPVTKDAPSGRDNFSIRASLRP